MKKLFASLAILSILCLPVMVGAADPATGNDFTTGNPQEKLTSFKDKAGFEGKSDSLVDVIGNIVKIMLTIVGIILLVIIVYAGFLWMTAGGNEDQVKKAKQWILNAVIGLALMLAAYAISDFVITNLTSATTA